MRTHILNWLPGAVSQSVLRQAFHVRLRSLLAWSRNQLTGVADLASTWRTLIKEGAVPNRAVLARAKGVSRARVTQVLGPVGIDGC